MGKRVAALVTLLALAACGSSDSSAGSPHEVPTSSTTAEEARAIDGPLMHYITTTSKSASLNRVVEGALQLEGDCLYLSIAALSERYPVLWPANTKWDATSKSVVLPSGTSVAMGATVTGRGGFFYLSDVSLLAGAAVWNLSARCVDNVYGQIAVFQNTPTAVGPKGP